MKYYLFFILYKYNYTGEYMKTPNKRVNTSLTPYEATIIQNSNHTPSELLKQDALGIATNDPTTAQKLKCAKKLRDTLIQTRNTLETTLQNQLQKLDKEIQQQNDFINQVEQQLHDYNVKDTDSFKNAVKHFEDRLRENHQERNTGNPKSWGLKKIPLDSAEVWANAAHADIQVFLSAVDEDLMRKELAGYNDLLRRWGVSSLKKDV